MAIGVSILGVVRLGPPAVRARGDHTLVIGLALVWALVVGGGVAIVFGSIAWGQPGLSPGSYLAVLVYAAPAGLLAAGMSLGGFAILTLGRPARRWAIVGGILGPVLLVVGYFLLSGLS